jgi:hypothetical protein
MNPMALTLAVAAIAAPAAGATLTKAQVIQRGTVICKAGERKVEALPQIRSQHPFAVNAPKGDADRATHFLAGYADALAGVRAGLATLDAPPQGRALLKGFIADLGPTVAAFRKAHADATAGRGSAAEAEAQRGFALFAKASRKTKAYGFPKGVCQSGSS